MLNCQKEMYQALHDSLYETKVDLYDKKCSGCGFCRIEIAVTKNSKQIFTNIDEAIRFAIDYMDNDLSIIRTCSYPTNIITVNGRPQYPSLIEITSNTCMFWDESNIPSDDDETSFIEISDIQNLEQPIIMKDNEQLSKQRSIRESIPIENISQPKIT